MHDFMQLKLHREAIIGRWKALILAGYPSGASGFLGGEKDRFANPVGAAIDEMAGGVFDEITGGMDCAVIAVAVDDLVKIRAVQNFLAPDAVRFIFLLKQAVLEELERRKSASLSIEEFAVLGSRIDEAALLVFEGYLRCRERLHEIKAHEIRRRNYRDTTGKN